MGAVYKADLQYLYDHLLRHPLLIQQPDRIQAFQELYAHWKPVVCDCASLADAASALTCFFEDGHTNIELPYTCQDLCLEIPCRWSDNGKLILKKTIQDLPAEAEIIGVENTSIETLVTALSARIPHENPYLVKSRMVSYPYQNYHLFSKWNLSRLFGSKTAYQITFSQNGNHTARLLPLVKYSGYVNFPVGPVPNFQTTGQIAVFRLDSCINDDAYLEALKAAAEECNKQNIKTFVLDLSRNMGGSSAVIDTFMQFVDMEHFRRFEMIDFTSGKAKCIVSRKDTAYNQKQKILLPKNIYCKVSHDTFSSAKTFAVTLKDNGVAKIIGSETGGKPSSYGLPERFYMPNSKISFRISRCLFLRPDAAKDAQITLSPDSTADFLKSI